MELITRDGVRLHAEHLPGPSLDVAVVVAHGFTGSTGRPDARRIRTALARTVGVVGYDARGHGRSAGLSTLGDREVLDLDAAVAAARRLGYRRVVTCGWSMGGPIALRHAALTSVHGLALEHRPDAVVSVSAVSEWHYRDTAAMRRVHFAIERRLGRAVARWGLRTRISPVPWGPDVVDPRAAASSVRVPLLLVHGDSDHYFPVAHLHALAAAAPSAEVWLEPGFGHAESGVSDELLVRLADRMPSLVSA